MACEALAMKRKVGGGMAYREIYGGVGMIFYNSM